MTPTARAVRKSGRLSPVLSKWCLTGCNTVISALRFRGKGNRRELVIEAGKSHKFTIPEDELPR